jgi:clan AA aspartic protease
VYVDGVVKHGGRSVRVRFLVDSGATYTVLTRSVWEELGLKPMGEMEFVLADGTVIRRAISEALLELPGYGERHTPVVLGESEDENLLGTVTLKIFGLVLDPFKRELRPIRALMKAMPGERRAAAPPDSYKRPRRLAPWARVSESQWSSGMSQRGRGTFATSWAPSTPR